MAGYKSERDHQLTYQYKVRFGFEPNQLPYEEVCRQLTLMKLLDSNNIPHLVRHDAPTLFWRKPGDICGRPIQETPDRMFSTLVPSALTLARPRCPKAALGASGAWLLIRIAFNT